MDPKKLKKNGRTLSTVAREIAGRLHGIRTPAGRLPPEEISLEDAELLQNSGLSLFKIPGGLLTPEEVVEFSKQKSGGRR